MKSSKRIIVGVSGASGAVLARRALEALAESGLETHLVVSRAAEMTIAYELGEKARDFAALAARTYAIGDVGAAISSGSFKTEGMIVAPCSIRSLSEIAAGTTGNLLTRAADVVLKERRRLVLLVRETPLHLGHLRSMAAATEMGAIVMPPVPAFYQKPQTIDDIVNQTVGRALDLFGIEVGLVKRWGESGGVGKPPRRRG